MYRARTTKSTLPRSRSTIARPQPPTCPVPADGTWKNGHAERAYVFGRVGVIRDHHRHRDVQLVPPMAPEQVQQTVIALGGQDRHPLAHGSGPSAASSSPATRRVAVEVGFDVGLRRPQVRDDGRPRAGRSPRPPGCWSTGPATRCCPRWRLMSPLTAATIPGSVRAVDDQARLVTFRFMMIVT